MTIIYNARSQLSTGACVRGERMRFTMNAQCDAAEAIGIGWSSSHHTKRRCEFARPQNLQQNLPRAATSALAIHPDLIRVRSADTPA
jgi:hypothetical protein